MSENHKNFVIDPSGDVLLTLSNPDVELSSIWNDWGHPYTDWRTHDYHNPPKPNTLVATFRLSSRHLSLASPVFKTMLSGPWMEGTRPDSDSLFQLTAESWNIEALEITMNIIHGRWTSVPARVSLATLAGIAVIIDYYDMRELLQVIPRLFKEDLAASNVPTSLVPANTPSSPPSFGAEIMQYLLISWVFQDESLFRQATKMAILYNQEELPLPDDTPIPFAVIDEINARTRWMKEDLASCLGDLAYHYARGLYGCSLECSCMQAGALMEAFSANGWNLRPCGSHEIPPEEPFGTGVFSLWEVIKKVQALKSPTWASYCPEQLGFLEKGAREGDVVPCTGCPRLHVCDRTGVLSFGIQELGLGVGQAVFTIDPDPDAVNMLASDLVERLEGNITMSLADFQIGHITTGLAELDL